MTTILIMVLVIGGRASLSYYIRARKRTFSLRKQHIFSQRFTGPGRVTLTPRAGATLEQRLSVLMVLNDGIL